MENFTPPIQIRNYRNTPLGVVRHSIADPLWPFGVLFNHFLSRFVEDDETFIKWNYFFRMHKFPNLDNPQTFNEKLQWMKLNDRNPLYTRVVDKYEAKSYVSEVLGTDQHVIPTLGVWDKFEDIDFSTLPARFVLKTTHDSGGVVICRDKAKFNIEQAGQKLGKSLKRNFYYSYREYPYKNVKPRIIAEEYMADKGGGELNDYKFFCFNGEPKMMFVATDRFKDIRFDYFDMDFNHLPFAQGHPWQEKPIQRPENFKEMAEMARKLSKDFHQVRVDLYSINGKVYFGELTFFHFSGNFPFYPAEWDQKIGSWWTLPEKEKIEYV